MTITAQRSQQSATPVPTAPEPEIAAEVIDQAAFCVISKAYNTATNVVGAQTGAVSLPLSAMSWQQAFSYDNMGNRLVAASGALAQPASTTYLPGTDPNTYSAATRQAVSLSTSILGTQLATKPATWTLSTSSATGGLTALGDSVYSKLFPLAGAAEARALSTVTAWSSATVSAVQRSWMAVPAQNVMQYDADGNLSLASLTTCGVTSFFIEPLCGKALTQDARWDYTWDAESKPAWQGEDRLP